MLLLIGLSFPLVVGARAVGQSVQDAMSWLQRRRADDSVRRVLLYGAGHAAMLFLRSLAQYAPQADAIDVVGFLDDDANLHDRVVFGYRVLGGPDQLERLVREHSVSDVIMFPGTEPTVTPLAPERAEALGVKLMVWRASLEQFPQTHADA
jgi:FlaA1/EpsC-like NDP-sugar epimerase